MSDRTVYIVHGSTGEYSDRGEWVVRAFLDENAAKAFVAKCGEYARAFESKRKDRFDSPDPGDHPLDPNFQCDYTGTHYYLSACPLEAA